MPIHAIIARWLCLFLLVLTWTTTRVAGLAPAVVHTIAGAIAGSSGAIAVYPIDYVKSQLQTEVGRAKYADGIEAAIDIVKTSPLGPLALYRGVLVNIVGIAPEKTIKLSANDIVRTAIQAQLGYLPLAGEIVAGGIAGMTQVCVTNPLEVVKVRMQTSDMGLKEVFGQMKGLGDLYQGAAACVVRDSVFSAVLFPLYAHAKVAAAAVLLAFTGPEGTPPSFLGDLLAGSLAAFPSALIATPADVVKTRIQQAKEEGAEPTHDDDAGFLEVAQSILANEGPEVFFSGSLERIVRSVPQFGVTLAMFDVVSDFAESHGWM